MNRSLGNSEQWYQPEKITLTLGPHPFSVNQLPLQPQSQLLDTSITQYCYTQRQLNIPDDANVNQGNNVKCQLHCTFPTHQVAGCGRKPGPSSLSGVTDLHCHAMARSAE